MKVEFEVLTSVYFTHTYFSDQKLTCLTAAPLIDSVNELNNHGLLFKPFANGFQILFDKSSAGRSQSKEEVLSQPVRLQFSITLNDAKFFNYTALKIRELGKSICYFNNAKRPDLGVASEFLHIEEFVCEEDIQSTDGLGFHFFNKPFGLIELGLDSELKESYYIKFRGQSAYWRYILCSDHLMNLENPAVIDSNNKTTFEGPEKVMLPNNHEAVVFVSKTPIELSAASSIIFQLVENYQADSGQYKVVKRALPVPDVNLISNITPKGKNDKQINYSEIFLY